jgi:hypothetical protein
MSIAETDRRIDGRSHLVRIPAWLWIGAGIYLLLLFRGNDLLNDPDMFWQLKVGQRILESHALPYVDIYSFTRAGAPWISTSWLSQILFAKAYGLCGWAGVVILAAAAAAAAFSLFVRRLRRDLPPLYCALIALVAFSLAAQHILARPHVLAMPVMVAWIGGLIAASDRRVPPSWWLLPLMALWANLHGSFVLGLVLIGPVALDAIWNVAPSERVSLARRWFVFGLCALAASCLTPYGWRSLAAAKDILELGVLLSHIAEWAPVSFAQVGLFEACMMLMIGAALWRGVRLSPPRILLALGLLHMGLSHVRNVEVFALLTPLVLAAPLSRQFGRANVIDGGANRTPLAFAIVAAVALAAVTWGAVSTLQFGPRGATMPSAALAALKDRNASRVLNDYNFGGAMIWRGMAPFVDGRTELYGEAFGIDTFDALSLRRPDTLLALLARYHIDATLLAPETPAARLLDHLDGWTKIFADETAVVHVRSTAAGANGSPGIR